MKKLLALILALGMVFTLCACGGFNDGSNKKEPQKNPAIKDTVPSFKVIVTDDDGNAVEGVFLQMCKDFCIPACTDASGVATFNLVVADSYYKLSVVSCPEGYEYTGEDNIHIPPESTEYALKITKK